MPILNLTSMQNNKYNTNILAACNRKLGSWLAEVAIFVGVFMGLAMGVLASSPAWAQGTPPAASANCTVTAMNRTAPLQGDYGFTIYNIPGAAAFLGPGTPTPAAPFRVRAACSDGTVGETSLAFPEFGSTVVYTGELFWRPATPIPLSVILTAAQNKLKGGETTQLTTTGVSANAQTFNLDTRAKGTLYTSSNPLIANVNQDGLATVTAGFATLFFKCI